MLYDVWTVCRRELQELRRSDGGAKNGPLRALLGLVAGAVFGHRIGAQLGASMLTVGFCVGLAMISVLPLIADAFAGERERHTLETLLATRMPDAGIVLGKCLAGVIAACIVAVLFATGAVVGAVASEGGAVFTTVRPIVPFAIIALTLVASGFIAAIGVLVSMRAETVKDAFQMLTAGMFVLYAAPVVLARLVNVDRWLALMHRVVSGGEGVVWSTAFVGLAMLDALLLWAAVVRFRRVRLVVS